MRNAKLFAALALLAGVVSSCRAGPQGPFCQSCAIPMDKPELFGTEANGARSPDYCKYCYQKGAFTQPDITMEQMLDNGVKHMVELQIMP